MTAVEEAEPVLAEGDVLEEVGGGGETEEVGCDEVHGGCVPDFVDVDCGRGGGGEEGEETVEYQGVRLGVQRLGGVEGRFGVDVGYHSFAGGVGAGMRGGEDVWLSVG